MIVKKLKIYTLLIHCFIVIGAGHGIGVMGIFDIIGILQIPEILKNGIYFDFYGSLQDRLSLVTIFSIFGKFFLILSLLFKNNLSKNITSFIGLIFLWASVYLLTSGNWGYDSLYKIAFWTSIPFLISSLFLTYYIAKKFNRNKQSLQTN